MSVDRQHEVARACAVTALALALTALIETARVPCLNHHHWLQLAVGSYGLSLLHVVEDLTHAVLFLPAFALLTVWQRSGYPGLGSARRSPRLCALLAVTLKLTLLGVVLGSAYEKLVLYPDFGRYAPAAVAFIGLFCVLAAAVVPLDTAEAPRSAGALRTIGRAALPVLALLAAGAFYAFDIAAYRREYPTLHVSLLQLAHLLLSIGLWLAVKWPRAPASPALRLRLAAYAIVALGVLTQVTTASAVADRAYPYWSSHTTLGQLQAALRPYSEPKTSGRFPPIGEARALALFRRYSGLPELPADFDLTHYNVLLVQSEATRFDQTSLFDGGPPTTPELRALRARGAYSFTRAYSPASGTYQSTAALHGMSYPSQLDFELWAKPWQGRYIDPRPMPAELFAQAGHRTFWVGHDKGGCFTDHALGFERGFRVRRLVGPVESHSATADARITAAAIDEMRAAARARERFFGWVFFVSPHQSYDTHYPDWPAATPLDRYRQEVRYVDDQIAAVMRELEALDLLSSTIVIYTGDHGEEFRDHGALWHGSSTYTELLNVPLVVWLPGMRGATLTQPTSTMYLFPWLFQRGTPAMRAAAISRLREHIGPMLQGTGGAVVSELLSPELMTSTLVYPDRKFNFAFNSGLHEAFRIDRDRLEHDDLYERDPALTAEAETRFAAYRALRADLRAFVVRPDIYHR